MTEVRANAAVTAGLAAGAALLAWVVGVTWYQSILVASTVGVLGAGWTLVASATEHTLPPRFTERRHGTRREVSWLSSTLSGRRGAVSPRVVARVRTVAEHHLARLGLDPHDPRHATATRELLGPAAYAVVIADPDRPVRHPAFLRCVDALERLADASRPAPGGPPADR